MQLGDDGLSLTGEMADMFAQVERTVRAEFKAVPDNLFGIIPLCALDSYLYRMVRKHGRAFQLSPQQVLKIGVNEQGKKFSKLSPATQEKKVRDILEDEKFIGDMIQLSGFRGLEQTLQRFLETKFTKMSAENLLMPLKEEMAALDAELAAETFPWIEANAGRVQKILQVYADLEKVDKATADACTVALYEKLRTANFDQFMKFRRLFLPMPKSYNHRFASGFYAPYQGTIGATTENLTILLKKYDDFREYADTIFPSELFDGILHVDTYPSDIVEAAYEVLLGSDLANLEFLEKLGCFDIDRVDRFLKSIVCEGSPSLQLWADITVQPFKFNRSKMDNAASTLQVWIPKLDALGVDVSELLHGIIIHFIIGKTQASFCFGSTQSLWKMDADEEYVRLMLYNKAREIPVRLLLESLPRFSPTYETAMAGLKKDYRDDPRFALDFMYLKYC